MLFERTRKRRVSFSWNFFRERTPTDLLSSVKLPATGRKEKCLLRGIDVTRKFDMSRCVGTFVPPPTTTVSSNELFVEINVVCFASFAAFPHEPSQTNSRYRGRSFNRSARLSIPDRGSGVPTHTHTHTHIRIRDVIDFLYNVCTVYSFLSRLSRLRKLTGRS